METHHVSRACQDLPLRHSCLAYNLIHIPNRDEWKTAFVTPTGHYEYRMMPYGLVNTPSIFQGFMNMVFWEYLHQFVTVYLDDMLIYSWNMMLALVLECLCEFQLFLKAEKCSL